MFFKRIATAVIGGGLYLLFLWLGSTYLFIVSLLISAIGLMEVSSIIETEKKYNIISGVLGGLIFYLFSFPEYVWLTLLAILLIGAISHQELIDKFWTFIWYFYFPIVNYTIYTIAKTEHNFGLALPIIATVWTVDTLAYFGGKLVGKRKIWPEISPNKTLEGTLIGLLAGAGAFYIAVVYTGVISSTPLVLIISGFLVSIAAILGDLFESLFKRNYNKKDSGNILPGHGGILDRFDSLSFAFIIFSSLISIFGWA